jgi:hypothetical protein
LPLWHEAQLQGQLSVVCVHNIYAHMYCPASIVSNAKTLHIGFWKELSILAVKV